jgi:hypothetical protein
MRTCLAWLLLVLLPAACLEIDGQEITVRFDEAADRIDVHLVHRGLFAEGGQGSDRDPLQKAVRDLADARQSGEVVFWCNWPLTLDLTREYPAPIQAVLAHLDVENGSLFTDPQGVLCAQQFVRVREAAAFVKKLNLAFELFAQQQLLAGTAGFGGTHTWDADTKENLREFLRGGEKLILFERGRLEVRFPFSAADHAWFKNQLERRFLRSMPAEVIDRLGTAERRTAGGPPTDTSVAAENVQVPGIALAREIARAPSYRFFWDNEWSLAREETLTRVGLGVLGSRELRITKAAGGLYHDALLEKLREDKEAIEDGVPDQELARRFDAFREREAVLPPKVAELRAAARGGK